MGKALSLVNKLNRRKKYFKTKGGGFDRKDKMDQAEEKMSRSQKAYGALLRPQRRLDRNLGKDMISYEPKMSKKEKITTVERYDFGVSDFGIRLTMASGLIADMHLAIGDIVRFLNGTLKGHYLKVTAIPDSTHIRLEDSSAMNYAGAKEKTQVATIADSAGSLNNKYFLLNSATDATAYYVWYNVNGAGVDPAPGGTGIMVALATNASANTVASATAAAVGALADFDAISSLNKAIITNSAVGVTTDSSDFNTGFTLTTLEQGAAANPTVSESNKIARFQLSDVKGSYK